MLKTLEFDNYRCFSAHSLPLKKETIIVGKNNAGKSTVIEGFRLVGLITERYKNLNFHDVPDWL
jgi:AAA15 family ATPase/GTPase